MSAIWESANWTRQFGIRQTGNRQFGMLPSQHGTQNVTFDTQYDFIDIILSSGESRGAIPLQVCNNIRFSIFV